MKRLSFLFVVIMLVSLTACNTNVVKGTIIQDSGNGYAVLDIMPQKLFEIAQIGESVVVTIGDFQKEMPLVNHMIAENGKLQLYYDSGVHTISIVSYNQFFCKTYNISVNSNVKIEKA